jgi:hypothetical protein
VVNDQLVTAGETVLIGQRTEKIPNENAVDHQDRLPRSVKLILESRSADVYVLHCSSSRVRERHPVRRKINRPATNKRHAPALAFA